MKPILNDLVAWQQAELLMQPAFIRVIDNIRTQLEESTWKGSYEETLVWPEGTSEDTKTTVMQLTAQLDKASTEEQTELEAALSQLPTPYPLYYLCLQHNDQQIQVDLWDLCYQICFHNYNPQTAPNPSQPVEIDTSLIDPEAGEVDWQRLDQKARQIVGQIFANLP